MGYKSGSGLGKGEQGITKPLDVTYQLGKRGFGSKLKNIQDITETWNFLEEVIFVNTVCQFENVPPVILRTKNIWRISREPKIIKYL